MEYLDFKNLKEIYGTYPTETQELTSKKHWTTLCGLLEHENPWVVKDALLGLYECAGNHYFGRKGQEQHLSTRDTFKKILDQLSDFLPEFYMGNFTRADIVLPLIDVTSRRVTYRPKVLLKFLRKAGGDYDAVAVIHSAGTEAGILYAHMHGIDCYPIFPEDPNFGSPGWDNKKVLVVDDSIKTGTSLISVLRTIERAQCAHGTAIFISDIVWPGHPELELARMDKKIRYFKLRN